MDKKKYNKAKMTHVNILPLILVVVPSRDAGHGRDTN